MSSVTARQANPSEHPRRPSAGLRLSANEVNALVVRWQQKRDPAALEALVAEFLPLVKRLARRYVRSSMPTEDLAQVGSIGLINAINRFDVSRGLRLQSFAIPTILGELRRHFRDSGWAIHVPRSAQERALAVRDAKERLVTDRGKAPTAGELAGYLEIPVEDVLDGLQTLGAYETTSLDVPSDERGGMTLAESLGGEDPSFALVEERTTATSALRILDDRQRLVIRLRFLEDLSQTEIGARIGVSQMQVSRILSACLEELQAAVAEPATREAA
jgi:RNA polymerase sigma-B factor